MRRVASASAVSAETLVRTTSYALFVFTFVVVFYKALRTPRKPIIDAALLFGDLAAIAIIQSIELASEAPLGPVADLAGSALVAALPYALVRLAHDACDVPKLVLHASEATLLLAIVGLVVFPTPRPILLTAFASLYFAAFTLYAAAIFLRRSVIARGVTQRRLRATSAGASFLVAMVIVAVFDRNTLDVMHIAPGLSAALGAGCAIGFYLGFARPTPVQRAWQDPELRAFLERAPSLAGLADKKTVQRELERGARESLGAHCAAIGFWNNTSKFLEFGFAELDTGDGSKYCTFLPASRFRSGEGLAGKSFERQQPLVSFDPTEIKPGASKGRLGVKCAIAGPITVGTHRIGVLCVYGLQEFLLAEEDLGLIALLAKQAASTLQTHELIAKETDSQARAHAALLEEGFLTLAAHELKTPLTRIFGHAQLVQRHLMRQRELLPVKEDVDTIVRQTRRMRSTIDQLLDAANFEHGSLLGEQRVTDLTTLVSNVCREHSDPSHDCVVQVDGPVNAMVDPDRIVQVLENLIGNAVKYSPLGGDVKVHLWKDQGTVHVTVTDSGIGIDQGDMDQLFTPFFRGSNALHQHFSGLGLGLFLSKSIIEAHHGNMRLSSNPNNGTTVEFEVPSFPDGRVNALAQVDG